MQFEYKSDQLLNKPEIEIVKLDSPCKMSSLVKSLETYPGLSNEVAIGHLGSVWSCTITSDNSTIFSGSDDKTVKIWDFRTRQCLHSFTSHTSTVNSLLLTNQERFLVSADWSGKLLVWDWQVRSLHQELVAHTCPIYSICQNHSQDYMLTGGKDSIIFIWKIDGFERISQVDCEGNSVFAIVYVSSLNEF